MIFYGDRIEIVLADNALSAVANALENSRRSALPIEGHAALIEALVIAGEVAQGLADAALHAAGHDEPTDAERAVMTIVLRLAMLAGSSWDDGFQSPSASSVADIVRRMSEARGLIGTREIEIKQPEGYAHYALYPESYWAAAKRAALEGPVQVIGVRSIGTSLSAMVAAALGAKVPLTVRPIGDPFARTIRPGPRLEATLCSDPDALRAIVDEGPGLSGSSFAAVAQALESGGVARGRLVFFPGHGNGPGSQAPAYSRELWHGVRQQVVEFDALAAAPTHRLENWVSDITGAELEPLVDLSAGRWRPVRFGAQSEWPPCDVQNERRKFLLHAERGPFLLKFAGIGASGRRTLARAKALADAGFTLAPLGLRHGFLVEHWRADLRPLDPASLDRLAFLSHLGAYLAFRARALAADPNAGASIEALFDMMIHNAREGLGVGQEPLACWRKRLPELTRRVSRVQTDNRLHAWEWLTAPDGRWIKADAVDHCAGHDLVGCQDLAWDAAGAAVEFQLTPAEEAGLLTSLARQTGRAADSDLYSFCKAAYAAFQLGAFSMARDRSEGEEARRLDQAAERYAAHLRREARKVSR